MPLNWTTYRLLLSNPPELMAEQRVFDAANARFAERVTMPEWILFALAQMRDGFHLQAHGLALEANIRFCDFFVQIYGEAAADPAYEEWVELAMACTQDAAFPMKSTVVLFRNPEGACEATAALRKRLLADGRCDVRDFRDAQELERVAEEVLTKWHGMIAKSA